MSKIKVGIIGAAGYTAGELLRILINHPDIEIVYVQSDSNAGNPIGSVHADLFHVEDLRFVRDIEDNAELVFLCKGHDESFRILQSDKIDKEIKIIDLSQDFRLKESHPQVQNRQKNDQEDLPIGLFDRVFTGIMQHDGELKPNPQ